MLNCQINVELSPLRIMAMAAAPWGHQACNFLKFETGKTAKHRKRHTQCLLDRVLMFGL